MRRTLLASTLFTLVACGSKGTSDDAPDLSADTLGDKPTQPLKAWSNGLAKQRVNDKMVVFDTKGGYQIHYPGNPDVDDGVFYWPRRAAPEAITVVNPGDPALIGFAVNRLPHRTYDAGSAKAALDDGVAALRTDGDSIVVNQDVVVAGLPARRLVTRGEVDGKPTQVDAWVVLAAEHDTLYAIVGLSHGDHADPMLVKIAKTFHRSPPLPSGP